MTLLPSNLIDIHLLHSSLIVVCRVFHTSSCLAVKYLVTAIVLSPWGIENDDDALLLVIDREFQEEAVCLIFRTIYGANDEERKSTNPALPHCESHWAISRKQFAHEDARGFWLHVCLPAVLSSNRKRFRG